MTFRQAYLRVFALLAVGFDSVGAYYSGDILNPRGAFTCDNLQTGVNGIDCRGMGSFFACSPQQGSRGLVPAARVLLEDDLKVERVLRSKVEISLNGKTHICAPRS